MSGPARPQRLPRRASALLEQGLVSGAHFVAFLLFARALPAEAWGAFSLAYGLVLFAQGFQRALVSIPLVAFSATPGGWDTQRHGWARANTALAAVGLLLLGAAAAGVALAGVPWLLQVLLLALLLAVPLLVHEFARRAAVQEGRLDLFAGMGALYALVLLAITAACSLQAPGTAAAVVTAWPAWQPAVAVAVAASAAAALYRLVARRAVLAAPGRPPRAAGYPAFAGWSTLGHLAYSGYNFGVQAVLAALAGPAAVGAFHACRTLVQPVSTLISAMDSIDKPRAATARAAQGLPAMRRVLLRTLGVMALLGVPYLALVALQADTLLGLAYGPRYADQGPLVWMWCLVALCSIVSQPVESGLYVAHRTRPLFAARALAALVALAAAVPLVQSHGAIGALAAMALGYALSAMLGTAALIRTPRLAPPTEERTPS